MTTKQKTFSAFALSSIALFMTALDNLVVTTALPVIKQQLGGGVEALEWVVNGYTLPFAVLLLTGAALGDRFGRRRMFVAGIGIFTAGSAAAALAPSIQLLIAARAFQGVGGAIITPLTLTILTDAVPAEKRGTALGAWSGIGGLAVALGPLVGGAVTQGISWQWIFWLNVPLGLLLLPLARTKLSESHGPNKNIDLPGIALASAGLLGIVWALVRGNTAGWTSLEVLGAAGAGLALLAAFVAWELRTPAPMLPMRFFRNRAFAAANAASLAMYFGMFGSVFLLTQFLQLVMGYSPTQAGVRMLAWTAMPLFVAPAAGALSDRIGGRPIMAFGLSLDAIAFAWIASVASPTTPYGELLPAFVLAGIGTASFFASVANVVMGAARPEEAGQASGATNAIREIGGVLGVAVLAAVFRQPRRLPNARQLRPRAHARTYDRRDHGRTRRCRGPAHPAAAARHRNLDEARHRVSLLTRIGDRVFGRVLTRSGHGGPPNGVVGRTGSGKRDPQLVEVSSRARALTRSARSTAAAATATAGVRVDFGLGPADGSALPSPGAGYPFRDFSQRSKR